MKTSIIISIMFLIICCSPKSEGTTELKILNDVFLLLVDTIAYKEYSLRPPLPLNDTDNGASTYNLNKNTNRDLAIIIYDTLTSLNKHRKGLEFFFKQNKEFNSYEEIIKKKLVDESNGVLIDISKLTNTGKYKLISNNRKKNLNIVPVGEVEFSRVAYNEELTKAAIVVTISDGEKAGVTMLVLLTKPKKWAIEREEILQIW